MQTLPLTTDMAPEDEAPSPEALVRGAPQNRAWSAWEQDGILCGTWTSTPGAWTVDYDVWEYVRMIEGRCALTPEGGARVEYGAGDSFIIPKGFKGLWETVEAMRKEYVIVE